MTDKKEMEVLSYLSQNNVIKFLTEYKKIEKKYKDMKRIYDKKIKNKLKDMVENDGIKIENDVFKVVITKPRSTKRVISLSEALKLPEDVKNMVLKDAISYPMLRITLVENEKEVEF